MNRTLTSTMAGGALLIFMAAGFQAQSPAHIDKQQWGTFDGKQVFLYTLRNAAGVEVRITNYGGTITSVKAPDRNKKFEDVVLGFDSLDGYTAKSNTGYFGALIGRYANRLAHGTFTLDGKQYHIPTNEGGVNTLHGGNRGFDKRVWDAKEVSGETPALELHYLSPDGEQGFPGNLNVTVQYSLDDKNNLRIDYTATTDKDTVLNLTNHSYWNLAGAGHGDILNHKLTLAADQFTPIDSTLIPTGVITSVAGTPLDFRRATAIGARIHDNYEQLTLAKGYDHNFVVLGPTAELREVASVREPKSGRAMTLESDQPGVQLYCGSFLDGSDSGKGRTYERYAGLCLESQKFPFAVNVPSWKSQVVLGAGERYRHRMVYRFAVF